MSQTPTHRPARRAAGLISARSHLTAGIAALGVGALALAPVQPITHQVDLAQEKAVSTLAVNLAATVDPITAWVDTFTTAGANVKTLTEFYMQQPFPLLQTIVANLGTYAAELEAGDGALIPEQIWGNIQTFFQAPWSPGDLFGPTAPDWNPKPDPVTFPLGTYLSKTQPAWPAENAFPAPGSGLQQSPSEANSFLLQIGVGATLGGETPEGRALWDGFVAAQGIWRFLNTPYSGQLLGLLGPVFAPVISLTRSFTAVGEAFQAGNVQDAIYELLNIPANMTNAVLNGGEFLDLTGIIGALVTLPDLFDGAKIGIRLGGLLNAMPMNGSLANPDNPPTEYASGTGFDSVAIPGCDGGGARAIDPCDAINGQPIPGLPNGWLGSSIGLGQFLAEQLLLEPPAPTAAAAPAAAVPAAAVEATPVVSETAPVAEVAAEDAPAVVDAVAEETAPAVDKVAEETAPAVDKVAEETAPAVDEELAEETAAAVVDIPEVEAAPADVADDPAPKPAATTGSDDAGDTGSRATESRRGASDSD
jgi:hypothetical protein